MGITNLPKPGINFKATLGPGSFQRKLSSATRYGGLKNLRDNQKAIVDVVKKYQGVIRIKGGLSRLQKRDAWLKLKKSTPLTYVDKYEAKRIIEHLGRGTAARAKGAVVDGKTIKASDGKSYLTEKQIARNLRANMQRDELIDRDKRKTVFSGNTVSKKSVSISRVQKDKNDLGLSRIGLNAGPVGFAGGQPSKIAPVVEKPIIKLAA
ncbi:MAG: hypothetical protein HYV53_02105 [Parcubacteria group bacterium]|nr:hypothetical protein [Parcubacteria group bacterium]